MTKMKKYMGIVIFIVTFIIIISIIAILIAKGYNITSNQITENGIIKISSNPDGAEIYIDDEFVTKSGENIEMLAGEHIVLLKHENYLDWTKKVDVIPSVVIEIEANLIPKEIDINQLTFTNISSAYFTKNGSHTIYTLEETNKPGIWAQKLEQSIFDISTEESRRIVTKKDIEKSCDSLTNIKYLTDFESNKMLISCKQEDLEVFLYIDINSTEFTPININEQVNSNPQELRFVFNGNSILIKSHNNLTHYNTETGDLNLISEIDNNQNEVLYTNFKSDLLLLTYNYNNTKRTLYIIDSQLTKKEVELPKSIDPLKITSISGSALKNYIVVNTNASSYILELIDNKARVIKLFSKKPSEVLEWSPDSSSFTYRIGQDLYTASVNNYPNSITKVKTCQLIKNYNPKNDYLQWAPNSQQLVIYNSKTQVLYIVDKDNTNKSTLYTGKLRYNNSFKLSENETYIILLIQDDKEYSNLYSLKLKV